jgi:rhomboid protease GluP
MGDPPVPTPDAILRLCADAAPKPWYPSAHAKAAGLDRDGLDEPLTQLRLAGLVQIANWEPGLGQGYTLTDAGRAILESPRALARLRNGNVPAPAAAPDPLPYRGSVWERGETVRDALLTRSIGPVTFALMGAQVLVFIAGVAYGQHQGISLKDSLEKGSPFMTGWLGVSAIGLAVGQWWRLITYCFVHGGAVHLIFNLIGHGVFGPPAERMFGPWRFLAIWVLSGIGGGCAAVYANPVGAIGSSGALCGLVGALVAAVFLNRNHVGARLLTAWRQMLTQVIVMTVLISLVPHVSAAGHLGGAVVGLVAGAFAHYQRFGAGWQKGAALLGLAAIPVLCITALNSTPAFRAVQEELRLVLEAQAQQRQDFARRLRPDVDGAADLTETVRKNVMPILEQLPSRRDARDVKDAQEIIERNRQELMKKLELVKQVDPLARRAFENARQLAIKYLETQIELLTQLDFALRIKDDAAKDRPLLKRAENEYRAAAAKWKALTF